MLGMPATVQTTDRKHHRIKKKSPNHFRIPSSSYQNSTVLCSELLSAQWQALSPVYHSVSFPACLHFLPDSSLSTLWCYLLLQLAIIQSALQPIFSLLHNLLESPTSLSWFLSLSPVNRWVTAVLNVRLSDRRHIGCPDSRGQALTSCLHLH